ncbi:hypothetical protein D3C73_1420910 [compost metagenome]
MTDHRMIAERDFADDLEALRTLGILLHGIPLAQNDFSCALNAKEKVQMPPRTAELAIRNCL